MQVHSPYSPAELTRRFNDLGIAEGHVGNLARSDTATMVHIVGDELRLRIARGPALSPAPAFFGHIHPAPDGSTVEGQFEYRSPTQARVGLVVVAVGLVAGILSLRAVIDAVAGRALSPTWLVELAALSLAAAAFWLWRAVDRAARRPYEEELTTFLTQVAGAAGVPK